MKDSNQKKTIRLGMSHGTASNRLRKRILFSLVQETNRDNCYRCRKKILDVNNFSIDHKIPWLNSENPKELFFDLNNITFSHLDCNIGCADQSSKQTKEYREASRQRSIGNCPHTKLSPELVKKIRIDRANGKTLRALTKEFSVSKWLIDKVIKRERWVHVK